ncbi:hypothetical protein ACF1GW_38735 [Streptomyces achromogenes]|uniref:hypothetical protein n=1 Tax=Streptomyces achromogenes TaxID=67255 RepID=UPI0037017149
MADFQIVTTDGKCLTEGRSYYHFQDLGYDSPRLLSFGYDGDYVVLGFEHGLKLEIPEHNIKYIATKNA